jgi:lysophospholipase L1-like esterase
MISPAFPPSSRTLLPLWCALLALLGLGPVRAAYEAEMAAFAAQDQANPPPANVIVFTGSSSITGWSGLQAAFPDYPVLNRGFGGSQMHDVLEKFGNVITPYAPPLIVLYEGDNDIWAGETPAAIFAEYVTFVDRVAVEFPATDIILIAVKPSPSRVSRLAAMAELNGLLRDLCTARPNLRYADVFTPMLTSGGQPRPELFGADMLHMNAAGYAIWKSVLDPLLAAAPFPRDSTLQFDFGSASTASGAGWNNVTAAIGMDPAGALAALVTATGKLTALGLEILAPFNALNDTGTTASSIFPASATSDTLYGNTGEFAGKSNIFPSFRLTGLDPALVYSLTFYASRTGVTDNRSTLYTVAGATTGSAVLDASENINGIAIVSHIAPDAQQGLTVSLSAAPANNSPNLFTYLGALKVDASPPVPVDTTAPLLLSGSGRQGTFLDLTFNEALDPASVAPAGAYSVNGGTAQVASAVLLNGGRIIALTLATPVSGTVSVAVTGVTDLAGNPVAPASSVTLEMPVPLVGGALLFDFGAAGTAMEAGDDPDNTWNNITTSIGTTDTGVLPNIRTIDNQPTSASLQMIQRFNGANTNGTAASTVYPADATRDTLFGNTEVFNSLTNIFPSFRLTGLDPSIAHNFTFYASRTGVSDNRETRYTVSGLNTVVTHLQASNNINGMAVANLVYPTVSGQITISLTPGPANNNSNHFTYLGVMQVLPLPPLVLLPPSMAGGQIRINWTGPGQLESADTPLGPWSAILPAPEPPFAELLHPSGRRFYRLRPLVP